MNLVRLIEVDRGVPVYVNPDYVTFIQQAIGRKGSLVGLVGDDLGCEVEGSPDTVAYKICPEVGKWDETLGVHVAEIPKTPKTADLAEAVDAFEAGCARRLREASRKFAESGEADTVRKPRKPYKHYRDKPRGDKCDTGESGEQRGA